MIQWIIIALILAGCLLWVVRKLRCRNANGGCDCCNSTNCPLNQSKRQ